MKNDITFHYTNENMVKDLMKLIPFRQDDWVMDAGSGRNKVWFNNIPPKCKSCEMEIEEGYDFLEVKGAFMEDIDWVIGNPPFDIGWKFTEQATEVAKKGIAFLGSIKFFNQFTSKRLEEMKKKGFELQRIHIVADARWYGRYYFLIFQKKKGILTWERKTYK